MHQSTGYVSKTEEMIKNYSSTKSLSKRYFYLIDAIKIIKIHPFDSSMDNIELHSVFQCIWKGINDGHLHSVEEDKIVDVAQSLIDEEDLMELRRKKTLLERVMARLRELITASQQTGETNKLQIPL